MKNTQDLFYLSVSDCPLKSQFLDTENQLFVAKFEFCYWVENHEIFRLESTVLVLNDWQNLTFQFWNGTENCYEKLPETPDFGNQISEGIFRENQIILKGFVQTPQSHWAELIFTKPQTNLLYEQKIFLRKQEIEVIA